MENGETRCRLSLPDKTTFHHTKASEDGWQRAHYHMGLKEVYIVLSGRMAIAILEASGDCVVRNLEVGECFTIESGVHHNVWLSAGATIATVTYGKPVSNAKRGGSDWYPSTEFDVVTRALAPEHLGILG